MEYISFTSYLQTSQPETVPSFSSVLLTSLRTTRGEGLVSRESDTNPRKPSSVVNLTTAPVVVEDDEVTPDTQSPLRYGSFPRVDDLRAGVSIYLC